jgi:hypothetical protein
MGIHWRILFALALWLLAIGSAMAADELQVDLVPETLNVRNHAPIPVKVHMTWNGTRILEGHLEMEFHEGNRVLGRYRSDELALTDGEQEFQMLLPPPLTPFSDSQVEVRMKFVTADGAMDVGPSMIDAPTISERSFVLGWFDSTTAAGESSFDIVRNLQFERLSPPDQSSQQLSKTSVTRLTPEDLPEQPLAYTAFDVVVLTAEALKEAHEHQLQALARWVKGGGSVWVFVGGGLQPYHVAFLNQLAESTSNGPAFLSDDSGNLISAQKGLLCLRSGLGRSVIATSESTNGLDFNGPLWRNTAAFLWKMRSRQVRSILDTGNWQPPASPQENQPGFKLNQQQYYGANLNYQYTEPFTLSIQPSGLGSELLARLMPKTVRLIPFSALIVMLILFLLLIGPGDYYILGFFKRRRLTWIWFPATSIVFTVVTILMANHYLGLRDQRCSLTVVDLDKDGSALRWNRYELVFTARDKQIVTSLKDALWTQLDTRTIPDNPAPYYRGRYYRGRYYPSAYHYSQSYSYAGDPDDNADPPSYDGTLPTHFQTSETIHQWQPQLNRTFSFEPPPMPLPANWNAIEQAWPDLPTIRSILSEKKPFRGDLYTISGTNAPMPDTGSTGILDASILDELCKGKSVALMFLVSQVSPAGGSSFEDIQAMDTSKSDSALAIVTQNGDDIVVYRRFFYGN